MNTTTQTQEMDEIIRQINELDGESTVKLLTSYGAPEDFNGLLNNRDHLIDVALVRLGKITQDEADKRDAKRNPESFEEFKARLEKEALN